MSREPVQNDDGGWEQAPTWRSRAGDFALILVAAFALLGASIWIHGCVAEYKTPRSSERR